MLVAENSSKQLYFHLKYRIGSAYQENKKNCEKILAKAEKKLRKFKKTSKNTPFLTNYQILGFAWLLNTG